MDITQGMQKRLPKTVATARPNRKVGSACKSSLPFVAVWALFGIKLFWRHAKDVVALDANAMNVVLNRLWGTNRPWSEAWRERRKPASWRPFYHAIAHSLGASPSRKPRPGTARRNYRSQGKCVEKWSNLLIDFRLAGRPPRETASKLHQPENCCSAGRAKAKLRPADTKRKNADRHHG